MKFLIKFGDYSDEIPDQILAKSHFELIETVNKLATTDCDFINITRLKN